MHLLLTNTWLVSHEVQSDYDVQLRQGDTQATHVFEDDKYFPSSHD